MGNIHFSVENIVLRKHSKSEGLQVIPLFSLQNLALRNNHDHFSTTTNTRTNILPVSIYLLKVNNRNTRTRCEIYSKLTTKIPERRHWRHSYTKFITLEIKCRFTFDEPDLY